MIIYLRLLSDEADNFIHEIAVDGTNTFEEIHDFIQQQFDYDPSQIASFFITDNDWHKETEIAQFDMGDLGSDEIKTMQDTTIGELISEKGQRLLYVFDIFSDRAFFVETFHISEGNLEAIKCYRNEGKAPEQIKLQEFTNEIEEPNYYTDEDDYQDLFDSQISFEELSDENMGGADYSDYF